MTRAKEGLATSDELKQTFAGVEMTRKFGE
jgi:hypothetical protein